MCVRNSPDLLWTTSPVVRGAMNSQREVTVDASARDLSTVLPVDFVPNDVDDVAALQLGADDQYLPLAGGVFGVFSPRVEPLARVAADHPLLGRLIVGVDVAVRRQREHRLDDRFRGGNPHQVGRLARPGDEHLARIADAVEGNEDGLDLRLLRLPPPAAGQTDTDGSSGDRRRPPVGGEPHRRVVATVAVSGGRLPAVAHYHLAVEPLGRRAAIQALQLLDQQVPADAERRHRTESHHALSCGWIFISQVSLTHQ